MAEPRVGTGSQAPIAMLYHGVIPFSGYRDFLGMQKVFFVLLVVVVWFCFPGHAVAGRSSQARDQTYATAVIMLVLNPLSHQGTPPSSSYKDSSLYWI